MRRPRRTPIRPGLGVWEGGSPIRPPSAAGTSAMPLARMNLGPIFQNAGWQDVLAFFVGLGCLLAGAVAVFYRFPPAGRAGRFAVFAGVAAVLLGVAYAVAWAIDACGYAPAGWLARFGAGWMWGVGLCGAGLAVTSAQRADPSDETR